ncbi:hypothetical protein ACFXCN_21030, partial [Streptomyces coelicoflavus]
MPNDRSDASAGAPEPSGPTPSSALAALPALFSEESRVRAFAAVALGAGDAARVARAAGLSTKDTAGALRRLRDQGVVTSGGGGGVGGGGPPARGGAPPPPAPPPAGGGAPAGG